MKKIIILIIILICINIKSYAGMTATALDIAGNAYEKNMGCSGVAIFNDIGGVTYNPSVIANLNSLSGSLTYFNYIEDFKMFYGNVVYPFSKKINILGRMPSITDIETGKELCYNEFFTGIGSGYKFFNNKLSVGGIVNFYSSKIADKSGTTVFLNAGANYSFSLPLISAHKFIIGFSFLNMGPGITYNQESSSLPLNFNLGIQYIYKYNYKLFTGLRKYTDYKGLYYNLGFEIIILKSLFTRVAIIEDINRSLKYNLGLGFDLNYTDYHFIIDYSFLPLESTESSSVITLSFRFPVPGEKKEEKNWKNMWTTE